MLEALIPQGPRQGTERWTLEGATLANDKEAHDLQTLTAVTLRISAEGPLARRALILHRDDGAVTITCISPRGRPEPGFDSLLAGIAAAVPEHVPAKLEQGRLPDWPKYLLGWFALVVAVALGWRAAVIGLTGDRMALVAAPMLILAGIGVTLIQTYRLRPRRSMAVPVAHLAIAARAL